MKRTRCDEKRGASLRRQIQGFNALTHKSSLRSLWMAGELISQIDSKSRNRILTSSSNAALLRQCVKFQKTYARRSLEQSWLTWGHYRILVQIKDADERSFYQHESLAHGWNAMTLKREVRSGSYAAHPGVGTHYFLPHSGKMGVAVGTPHSAVQHGSKWPLGRTVKTRRVL